MALTAGLLTFLGVEALSEAFAAAGGAARRARRPGLVLLGVALSFLGDDVPLARRLGEAAGALGGRRARDAGRDRHRRCTTSARGWRSARRSPSASCALGTFLIVGFMVHNVTEGLGIAAPAADGGHARRRRPARRRSPLIAGAPAILGAWIGGFLANDVLAVLFFAIAAGAALPGGRRGRPLRRAPGARRAPLGLRDRRLPRRDRRHVRHRAARRLDLPPQPRDPVSQPGR